VLAHVGEGHECHGCGAACAALAATAAAAPAAAFQEVQQILPSGLDRLDHIIVGELGGTGRRLHQAHHQRRQETNDQQR
jgi:hypothetical protein